MLPCALRNSSSPVCPPLEATDLAFRISGVDCTCCQKLFASEAPDPGRHHVGIPDDIISECPGSFVGRRGWRGRAATPRLPQVIFIGIAPKKSRLPMSTPQ